MPDTRILYAYAFSKTSEEREINLFLSLKYQNHEKPQNSDIVVFESFKTKSGIERISGLAKVVSYQRDVFNLAESRNIQLKCARDNGYDILILMDADVIVKNKEITNTISYLTKNNFAWGYPYCGVVYNIPKDKLFLDNKLLEFSSLETSGLYDMGGGRCKSMCYVLNLSLIKDEKLFDEEFRGWGFEDTLFYDFMIKKYGKVVRTKNHIFHIDHLRSGELYDTKQTLENQKLYNEKIKNMK